MPKPAGIPPQALLRPKNQITVPAEIVAALHAREGDNLQFRVDPESGDVTVRATRTVAVDQAWFWTPEWQAGEREADAEIAAGGGSVQHSLEAFLDALDEHSAG